MNKRTQLVIVVAALVLVVGGAAWYLRDRQLNERTGDPVRAEYDALVAHLGGDEPAIRDELNDLMGSASVPLDASDQTRVNALTRECLDPKVLLDIGHIRSFLGPASRGEAPVYHFVKEAHRPRLAALAGDNPSPDRVLAVRKALARLGAEFGLIRQPPDWNVKVEGDAPPMPFLELLRAGPQFLPASRHPELRPGPRIPAFSGGDGELLAQLEQYFNGAPARSAFPPEKFPKLYVNGHIPPVPTALGDYRKEIAAGFDAEKLILLPGENPSPEGIEAVNDVYGKLDRFLSAVIEFGK